MIIEMTYTPEDLKHGQCSSCGEISEEKFIGDGRCVDCIEEERFINMTMVQGGDPYTYTRQDLEDLD